MAFRRWPAPFGGIGFCGFECDVVDLAGGGTTAFTAAMAFAQDGGMASADCNPDPGDIDGDERAAGLPGEHTAGVHRLPAPAIKAKDPVGLRDRIPAFDLGQRAAMGLTGADILGLHVPPQRLGLFC
jgi:hypothetical protein